MFRKRLPPSWYVMLAAGLREFVATLPPEVNCKLDEQAREVSLTVKPPTPQHRTLSIDANYYEVDYELGRLWGEFHTPTEESCQYLLAMCDAVRDGRFREVKEQRTGQIYHVLRLKSRGLDEFARDSDFSPWHYLRLKIRRVSIKRIPPLDWQGAVG